MSIYVDIEKKLGDFRLKLKLEAGDETLAFLGASGCGKSMTLKCIAGIEKPDAGRIIVNGVTLFDSEKHINVPAKARRTGLMFQNYALFPNMTVKQNILAGTRRDKSLSKAARIKKTEDIMKAFSIEDLSGHLPSQLSGGQQQRTALARMLVSDPEILLLDEPFSALDSHLRFRMEQEMRQVIRDFGRTVILVSHNRDEVFRLSDKVAIMDDGGVEAFGTRDEVFRNPVTRNACILTGCKNISPIKKLDERHLIAADWDMPLETEKDIGDASFIGIRHHYIHYINDNERNDNGCSDNNNYKINEYKINDINTFLCDVVSEIENPFSYTIMLRITGKENAGTFGWELDKDKWRKIKADRMRITVPKSSILLLKD